mmetsp:Transcript_20238/g.81409  ORF Transcript_20238/g.81409 Transcript_20238/m.81409 type:complete len:193 (-) Transcript_20238:6317-6895(-)
MGKNRDTHDPETVLPEAISEELENFNAKKTNGSTEREPKHLVSFGTGRKQLRREKREQKKKNKMLALKDWRERRQQKRPRSTRVEETKASVDVEDDSGKKKRKSKKKEKRSRIEEEEEGVVGEEQQVMDPDQAEEERLQKLLFNSSKKQKKVSLSGQISIHAGRLYFYFYCLPVEPISWRASLTVVGRRIRP